MNKASFWKNVILTLAVTFSGALLWNSSGFGVPTPEKQNIVIHLSHATDDLHRATMALDLALALQRADANVTIFMDLEGVRIVDKNLPQDLAWGFGTQKASIQQLIQNFTESGGKLMLCPHSAEAAGLSASSLKTEAKIAANPEEVARLFLAADKVIDY